VAHRQGQGGGQRERFVHAVNLTDPAAGLGATLYNARVSPVVSLSLQRYPILRRGRPCRRWVRITPCCAAFQCVRFYRLMGTGRGADLVLAADLRRWRA
jgi:hypothetical protein